MVGGGPRTDEMDVGKARCVTIPVQPDRSSEVSDLPGRSSAEEISPPPRPIKLPPPVAAAAVVSFTKRGPSPGMVGAVPGRPAADKKLASESMELATDSDRMFSMRVEEEPASSSSPDPPSPRAMPRGSAPWPLPGVVATPGMAAAAGSWPHKSSSGVVKVTPGIFAAASSRRSGHPDAIALRP